MRAKTFSKFAKQVPVSWLPFADVASPGLPMARLLRLSLFKFTMGITTALMIGTLNRVIDAQPRQLPLKRLTPPPRPGAPPDPC